MSRGEAAANAFERAVPLDELELNRRAVRKARLQNARAVLLHGRHIPAKQTSTSRFLRAARRETHHRVIFFWSCGPMPWMMRQRCWLRASPVAAGEASGALSARHASRRDIAAEAARQGPGRGGEGRGGEGVGGGGGGWGGDADGGSTRTSCSGRGRCVCRRLL
jgi:hypothetical protein